MGARTKARKRALDILYSADLRGVLAVDLLAEAEAESPQLNPYTGQIVRGVVEHAVEIDAVLAEHAHGWSLERMPAVDRNLLRVAVWELRHSPDVPDPVAISEAVNLARELSTDDSPGFINGVLGALI